MKRYRVVCFSFDSSPLYLTEEIRDTWSEEVKGQHRRGREQVIAQLSKDYGESYLEHKVQNASELGNAPFSVISYHTVFFRQIRTAFIAGGYYPALTGACALGERILNHLLLKLRQHYKDRTDYKRVYRKASFDDWKLPIDVLESWDVLLPEVVSAFRQLRDLRNDSIHFRLNLEEDARTPALSAMRLMRDIIAQQFPVIGPQPWFIRSNLGESYIRKDAEDRPFIREFYVPCCVYVGPDHVVRDITGATWDIADRSDYAECEIEDEEFVALRRSGREKGLHSASG